nr:unnamed protein product [Spirometra erinaceieuropaei]
MRTWEDIDSPELRLSDVIAWAAIEKRMEFRGVIRAAISFENKNCLGDIYVSKIRNSFLGNQAISEHGLRSRPLDEICGAQHYRRGLEEVYQMDEERGQQAHEDEGRSVSNEVYPVGLVNLQTLQRSLQSVLVAPDSAPLSAGARSDICIVEQCGLPLVVHLHEVAAPAQLQLPQHVIDAEDSRPLQYIRFWDPVLPLQLQYLSEAVAVDVVSSPYSSDGRMTAFLHLQFGAKVETASIPNCVLQTAEGGVESAVIDEEEFMDRICGHKRLEVYPPLIEKVAVRPVGNADSRAFITCPVTTHPLNGSSLKPTINTNMAPTAIHLSNYPSRSRNRLRLPSPSMFKCRHKVACFSSRWLIRPTASLLECRANGSVSCLQPSPTTSLTQQLPQAASPLSLALFNSTTYLPPHHYPATLILPPLLHHPVRCDDTSEADVHLNRLTVSNSTSQRFHNVKDK